MLWWTLSNHRNDCKVILWWRSNWFNGFFRVECNIENNVNLNQFIENFKGKKWLAKQYNVVFQNCQDFACVVIKFLKATRKDEEDKIRL